MYKLDSIFNKKVLLSRQLIINRMLERDCLTPRAKHGQFEIKTRKGAEKIRENEKEVQSWKEDTARVTPVWRTKTGSELKKVKTLWD